MTLLYDILEHNRTFVDSRQYEPFESDKYPDKRLVVLSCMDTRLVELLPKAMNLRNGDFKLIKNAGGIVSHPFGSVMRSIIVAIYELGAGEVCVVGHHDCGMSAVDPDRLLDKMEARGVKSDTISVLEHAGIDLRAWLKGFSRVEDAVKNSVEVIKNHPLLPAGIPVHGLVIDPQTGKLDLVVDGYALNQG